MQDTLGSVRVEVTPLVVPMAVIRQPLASQIRSDVAVPEPDLAWQSSIGQFIFLQSLAQERI